jgi:signal transduction histidine kinase
MSPRKNAQAAFASAVMVLLLSAVAAYFAIDRFRTSERWVDHTYQVQAALGETDSAIFKAGRTRNSYLATPSDSLSAAFEATLPEIQQKLDALANLIADNPRERQLMAELKNTTAERMDLFRQEMALRQSSPNVSVTQSEIGKKDLALAFERASIMQQMRNEEEQLLRLRTVDSNRFFSISIITLAVAFALALVLFSIHYRLLNSELAARELAEHAARESEESLRHLTARLLQMQDEERRKFSRELHDSLGQYLAGIKMNLEMVARTNPTDELLLNAIQLLDQSIAETRTISHLLHPPLLDEVGFSSAAKWYLQGFSERSGVEVKVEIPDNLGRLPRSLELGLFRVLQESLTNIHRHSKSSKAEVALIATPSEVVLRVQDYGSGIPQELLRAFRNKRTNFGVGLSGMRERVRELNGQLEIESNRTGTLVSVTLPIKQKQYEPVGSHVS